MAEALLRQKFSDRRIAWAGVTSAGLVASPTTIAHSQLRGVLGPTYRLIEQRRSKPLTQALIDESDPILGMEDRHVRQILERFPESNGRVDKITSFAGRDGEIKDFPESEYGDVAGWLQECYSIMVPCIDTIAERLIRERKPIPGGLAMEKVD